MINQKILSEVLGIKVIDFDIVNNNIRINLLRHEKCPLYDELHLSGVTFGSKEEINIYELANKCKEWLFDSGVDYTIWRTHNHRFYSEKYHLDIESDTEIEAIFKATQYVYDNLNCKGEINEKV